MIGVSIYRAIIKCVVEIQILNLKKTKSLLSTLALGIIKLVIQNLL